MRRISSQSDEFIRLPVWASEDGEDVDVTQNTTVKVAFVAPDQWDPASGDFVAGSWEVDDERGITYARRKMTGLTRGKYRMWLKIEGAGVAPETPVMFTDVLFEVV